jgi:ATP-dependent Clp protease ATP-binding subunit ClpA
MALHAAHNDLFASNGWLRPEAVQESAFKALQRSVRWASETGWDSVRTPHLFMGLLSVADRQVRDWCRMLGSDPDSLLLQFAAMFTQPCEIPGPLVRLHREFLSENALRVIRGAGERARLVGRSNIGIADLLIAMFSPSGSIVADCFADVGYPPERLVEFAMAAMEDNPES